MRLIWSAMALAIAAAGPAHAQATDTLPVLNSSGSFSYRVDADAVEFQVIVEGKGNAAAQAAFPCANVVDSVRSALLRLNLPSLSFDVVPQGVAAATASYGLPATGERFVARSTFRVRLTDVKQLARVTAAALDAGASRTAMFAFTSTRLSAARHAAEDSAMAEAIAEARRSAELLGGRLGTLLEVNGGSGPAPNYYGGQDQSVQSIPEIRGVSNYQLRWRFLPAAH